MIEYPAFIAQGQQVTTASWLGGPFIGLLLETLLMGAVATLTAQHFNRYSRDIFKWWLSAVILFCFLAWGFDL